MGESLLLAFSKAPFARAYGMMLCARSALSPQQSSMTLDATMPQERMANHVRFTGRPGDMLLFDTACYHTAMPNRHGKDRRAIIMGWTTSTTSHGQVFSKDSCSGSKRMAA